MNLITPHPMVSTRAAEEIRAAILNGSLSPGSRVRQEELAAKLGVSREPIRKALLVLEREGLVNVVNRGAVIAPVDPHFISEIYEFRETVETYVAAKVAEQEDFDPTVLRGVIAQGRRAVREATSERLIDLDLAFHSQLYQASGNRVVMDVMRTQWSHIRRVMSMRLTIRSRRKQVWDEHEAILEAIVDHDVSRSRTLASAHIRAALALVMSDLQANLAAQQENR
jgi:DNA-binding GntR family transcriptional regulator